MNWIRLIARIATINVAIVMALIGGLVAGPIVTVLAYNAFHIVVPVIDSRQNLPNYDDIDWTEQYFKDHKSISSSYSDFVVWELDSLSSETINIGKDSRRYTSETDESVIGEVWVFGGSTVFGAGVNDANTIPSLVARQTGLNTVNFGQDNYIARQSVISLLRETEIHNSENLTVVFYDGVNDVQVKCRTENLDLVTDRQTRIRAALGNNRAAENVSINQLFRPALVLMDKIAQRGVPGLPQKEPDDLYICDDDADRSDKVARELVTDWMTANAIAEAIGGRFVAILQPVSYLSDTRLDHLPAWKYDTELARQYSAVYPLIRSYALAASINFYDLSHVFDHDEFIYIDFCHVSPNGNEYIAAALANILS